MPGIVDNLIAPELARMIGDDFAVEQHDDALGMGAHEYHPASGARIHAVAIVVGHASGSRVALIAFSTKPSPGPRNSIRLARSSWNTSQMGLSLNSGCWVRSHKRCTDLPARHSLGKALHARLRQEELRRADCRPGSRPAPSPQPDAGVHATGSIRWCEHICKKAAVVLACLADGTSLPPPSSCCRRCRVGRPRRKTGTPCRGRRRPVPGSRGSRRERTACGCATSHVRRLDHQRGRPWSVIVSWLQSNWKASPGAKLMGTNAWAEPAPVRRATPSPNRCTLSCAPS